MIDVVSKLNAVTGKRRLQEANFDDTRAVVRVLPANEHVRRVAKHGVTKVGFQAEGSTEWPNDTFTRRRIRDGDVFIEAADDQPQAQAAKAAKKLAPPDKT